MSPAFNVDFIGIGAPKCGSTWLFHALGQHPRICLSEPKEVNYFNRVDFTAALEPGRGVPDPENKNFFQPIDRYRRCFGHCDSDAVKGEFSPTYYCDPDAASRIKRDFPNAKLLACLRNPADCTYAIYQARRRYRRIEKCATFEEALEADWRYLNYGFFGRHLSRVLEHFDSGQLKIVLLDDIVERPEATIRDVFGFLGLETGVAVDLQRIPKNKARRSGIFTLEPWMKRFSAFLIDHDQVALLHRLRNLGLKELAMKFGTVETSYPAMHADTRTYLREAYVDDLAVLHKLSGRDLSDWI